MNVALLNLAASIYERETTKDKKFKHFINQDIAQLIRPSYDEKFESEKGRKSYRIKINSAMKNVAIALLRNEKFGNDILQFAKQNALLNVRYEIDPYDFYALRSSPAISAWKCRLEYLSSYNWQKNFGLDIKSYADAYLPQKFEKMLRKLMDKYGLEYFWYESILLLLLSGIWYLPRNTSVIHLDISEKDGNYFSSALYLEIFSLTTRREIDCRWQEIEHLKSQIFPASKRRIRPREKTEDIFTAIFDDRASDNAGLGAFADDQMERIGRTDRTEYKKQLDKARKTKERTLDDRAAFLDSYKKLPPDVLLQIETLGSPLSKISIF